MAIRPFVDNVFREIESIYNLSKLDELRYEHQEFRLLPISEDEKRLNNLMESKILVFEDDTIIGYGAYSDAEIRALFVHPSFPGLGVGNQLFRYLLALVHFPAVLYVAKTNEPAKLLYLRYGFQVVDEFMTTYNGVPVAANKLVCSEVRAKNSPNGITDRSRLMKK